MILLKSTNNIFDVLNNSSSFNVTTVLIGIAIGVIGVVTEIILYKRGKKKEGPVFHKNSSILVGKNKDISDLKILYQDTEIEMLTITTINFFNKGEVIEGDQIHTFENNNKILFTISDEYKILKARHTNEINEDNEYDINYTDKYVEFSFNYVGHQEGCFIEIIHTGLDKSININGSIKKFGKVAFSDTTLAQSPPPIFLLVLMLIVVLIKSSLAEKPDKITNNIEIISSYSLALICFIEFILKPIIKKFKSVLYPKK